MKQYLAVATKIITDNSWNTDWSMLCQMFGVESYANSTHRLFRSQSWSDDDYPSCVLSMFNSILSGEGEEKTKSFIQYVLDEELKSATDDFKTKNEFLLKQLETATSDSDIPVIQVRFTKYINLVELPDEFYHDLQDEINRAYSYGLFSVIPFLIRKLFENLIVDIFKKYYGTSDINKYYDTANHRCHNFLKLIETLKNNIGDFTHLDSNFDLEFIKLIDKHREVGNSAAHSISIKYLDDDLNKLSDKAEEIEHIAKLLIRILNLI